MKRIYSLVIGFLLIILDFPIYLPIEIPIYHLKDEPTIRSLSVELIYQFFGHRYYIDLLSDVVGYIVLIVVAYRLLGFHKRFNHIMYSAIAGLVCAIAIPVIPALPLELIHMVYGIGVLKAVDYFAVILLMFSMAKAVYAQVDGYMYLEMWNEFKTDWLIVAIAPPFIYVLGLADMIEFPLSSALAVIIYGVWLYAGVIFIYNVYDYGKKLKIFGNEKGE